MIGFLVKWVAINYRLSDFLGGWDSESFARRMELNWLAIKMWRANPLLGVGLNNFWGKAGVAQPAHNIPLLWLAELGIAGILVIFQLFNYELRNKKFSIIVLVILVTAMMDHYWWTLPQNGWLLVVAWAVLR